MWPQWIRCLESKITPHPSLKGKSPFFKDLQCKFYSWRGDLLEHSSDWLQDVLPFAQSFSDSSLHWFTLLALLRRKKCAEHSLFLLWNLMPLVATRSILIFLPSQNNTFFLNLPCIPPPATHTTRPDPGFGAILLLICDILSQFHLFLTMWMKKWGHSWLTKYSQSQTGRNCYSWFYIISYRHPILETFYIFIWYTNYILFYFLRTSHEYWLISFQPLSLSLPLPILCPSLPLIFMASSSIITVADICTEIKLETTLV